MISKYLSDKFRILSFFLIVLVLFIHSPFIEAQTLPLNAFIQDLISKKIGRLAVPLFYIISGYLFFCNIDSGLRSILKKLRKRVFSIFIPYLIGSLFFLGVYLFLQFTPLFSKFVNGNILTLLKEDYWQIFRKVFLLNDNNYPLAFHLWFLRDLIFIIILSPVIFVLFKYLGIWSLIIIFLLSFLQINPVTLPTSLFWFSLGGVLSYRKINIELKFPVYFPFLLVILYFFLSYIKLLNFEIYLIKLILFIGILFFWTLYDAFYKLNQNLSSNKLLTFLCSFTFFIYVYHEPTLNIIKKLFVFILGQSSSALLFAYFFTPFIFILISILVGQLIKMLSPKFFSILVGGRSSN